MKLEGLNVKRPVIASLCIQVGRKLLICLTGVWLSLFGLRAEVSFNGPEVVENSGITMSVTQLLDHSPGYGFVPVRVVIRNESGKERTWSFDFTAEKDQGSGFALKQARSITVEDGKTRTTDFLIPLPGIVDTGRSAQLQVNVSGYGIERPYSYTPGQWSDYPTAFVGMSRSYYSTYEGQIRENLKTQGYPNLDEASPNSFLRNRAVRVSSRGSDRDLAATALDFSKLPTDWRSYSSLAEIILSDQEWRDLPKAQEQAIREWMALGGKLVIVGAGEGKYSTPLGFGERIDLGFDSKIVPLLMKEILALDVTPAFPWQVDFVQGWNLNKLVGPLKINTGLIISFVVIFGIIIAPINLFLFAPLRFRHRLFWTVPLISVIASMVLILVIVLQDGFGGTGARIAVVLLLPEEHKLAVVQEQVARTALLLNREFPLSDKVLFAGLPTNREGVLSGVVSRQEDSAGGDWFSSRTVKGYQLKAIIPSRSSVEIVARSEDGAPTVLSSVPVELKNFNLYDADGKIWKANSLKTGEKQILVPQLATPNALHEVLLKRASPNLQALVSSVEKRPGYFYAVAGAGGGIPLDTLASIRWKEDQTIYLGPWTEAKR